MNFDPLSRSTNTGALGFIHADVRAGSKIEGWSVQGGARYTFAPDVERRSRWRKPMLAWW